MASVPGDLLTDIKAVQSLPAVPLMLELICRVTGMGFSAVARVSSDRWIACRVKDNVNFGLLENGELKVETTICSWIRDHSSPVAFDELKNEHHQLYRDVAAMYGFTSYISYPIYSPGGIFFGTICAIDPGKMNVESKEVKDLFSLFSEWISIQLQKIKLPAEFLTKADRLLNLLQENVMLKTGSETKELIDSLKGMLAN